MECSEAREALSAWADDEVVTNPLGDPGDLDGDPDEAGYRNSVRAHVDHCVDCQAFERRLAELAEATSVYGRAARPAPDLAPAVMARARRRRESRMYILRWAVGLMGGAELANALMELILHGTAEAHATHESLSFAIAISLALVCASLRADRAAGYVPVVGTAVGLLLLTAGFDVARGRVAAVDELPHVDLLVGFIVLCLIAREHGNSGPLGGRPGWHPRPPGLGAYGGLRLVPGLGRALRSSAGGVARRGVRIGLGAAIATAVVLVPSAASAHAVIEGSNPAPDAVVATAPSTVTLSFSESITAPPGALRVYAPDGSRADSGEVSAAGSRLRVPLRSARATGTYLVAWRVVSADSHPVSGAFTFSVGAPSAAPHAPKAAGAAVWQTVLGVSRFAGYAGAAALVGGAVFWLLGWTPSRRGRRSAVAGAAVAGVAGVVDIVVKGPLDAGLGWGSLGSPSLIGEVLGTSFGRAELARIVLLVLLLLIAVPLSARLQLSRVQRTVAVVIFGLLIALSFALAGHAAAGGVSALSVPSWTLHALSMMVWLGGLAQVILERVWRSPEGRRVLRRFSALALACVATLVVSGVFQGWRQVRSLGALAGTTYGHLLSIKVGLVLLVVGVAYASRRAVRAATSPEALGRTVALEATGLFAVLAITSSLVATEPARTAWQPTVAKNLVIEGDTVQVSAVPAGSRRMELHLYVFDQHDQPVDPAEITATIALAGKGIGPLPVNLQVAGTGHRTARISAPIAGDWRLSVTVRVSDFDEDSRSVTLPLH